MKILKFTTLHIFLSYLTILIVSFVQHGITITTFKSTLTSGITLLIGNCLGVLMVVKISYSKLVKIKKKCQAAYIEFDNQNRNRHELIINLIKITKSYLTEELQIENQLMITSHTSNLALHCLLNQSDYTVHIEQVNSNQSLLNQILENFLTVIDSTPDLKNIDSIQILKEQIRTIEYRLTYAAQNFNNIAIKYNNRRKEFPDMLSNLKRFKEIPLLEFTNQRVQDPIPSYVAP